MEARLRLTRAQEGAYVGFCRLSSMAVVGGRVVAAGRWGGAGGRVRGEIDFVRVGGVGRGLEGREICMKDGG